MTAQTERYREPAEPPDAHFLAATKAPPDAVVILDRLGRIHYVSPVSRQLVGYDAAEIIGSYAQNWVHPDDLAQVYRAMEHWGLQDQDLPLVGRLRHADGRWRWVEGVPMYGANPTDVPDQFVFLVREITGHRRLEQRYRLAESIASFGVWRVPLDHPMPEFSAGLVELFGYAPGDRVSGKKKFWPLSMVHRSDLRDVLDTFRRAIRTPQCFSFTCRIHACSGVSKILNTRGYVETDVTGKAVAVTGVSQDITLFSMTHAELKASEEKYRLLTDRATDIICQIGADGTIEFISPAAQRILGRSPSDLKGKDFKTVILKEDQWRFMKGLTQAISGDEESVCTVRAICANGQTVWLEISGRRLKNSEGDHLSVVCAARDITERKKFETELENARLQAEEANASKSRFLSNVSHDLRTPLNAILGFAELIREQIFGPVGDPRYAEYAVLIHESGTLLRSFLADLIDLSRIEAGKYELNPERIELRKLAPSCVRQIAPLVTQKHLEIEDKISRSDIELFADRHSIAHILINLLSNAAKFTPDCGRIELSAQVEGDMIALTVRDTGIGIKPEDIERITAPFEQAFSEYGFAREGTGLGLAIVKSLAELHGGDLTIESEPGKGTCVTVRLPRNRLRKVA